MVRGRSVAARVALASLAAFGCGVVDGLGAGSTGSPEPDWVTATQGGSGSGSAGSGSEDAPGDGSGSAACSVCAPPAPDGWEGPVVRAKKGATVECGGDWPKSASSFFDAFVAPEPSECTCTCNVDFSEICYTGVWRHDASATCESYTEFMALDDACVPFDATSGSMIYHALGGGEPDCKARLESSLPEIGWGELVGACEQESEGDEPCDAVPDGVCWPEIPEGFERGLCVWSQGDLSCPAGTPFVDKRIVYNGVATDTRACSVCTCGDVGPFDCSGDAQVFASDDCSGAVAEVVPVDSCTAVDGVASVRRALSIPLTCEQFTESMPVGSVDISGGVFTYCCTDPA